MDKSANSHNKFGWTKLDKLFKLHVLFVEMKFFKKYITLKYSVYIVWYIHLTEQGRFRNGALVCFLLKLEMLTLPLMWRHIASSSLSQLQEGLE